jgi:threonine dehydrogenase-like Zn-dependent dehydrogenase
MIDNKKKRGSSAMKRRVAKIVKPKKFEIIEEELPKLKEDEVLLRIQSCGLCHSDVPVYLGEKQLVGQVLKGKSQFKVSDQVKFPAIVGHEPVATIEDKGSQITEFEIGDWVSGWKRECFADYLVADTSRLVKLDKEVKEKKKCLVEPMTCVTNILRAANPEIGDTVVIIGCGVMGLLCVAGLKNSSAFNIIATDFFDSRLKKAQELGATHAVNAQKEDTVAIVNDLTNGNGADIVIEITGRMAGFHTACQIIKRKGKILIPSLYAKPEPMQSGFYLMLKSPIIHSTHPFYSDNYDRDMKIAYESYKKGVLPINKLITHSFKFEDINEAFEKLVSGDSDLIKGIVEM